MSGFWERRRAAVAAEEAAEIDAVARAEVLQAQAELDALPDDEILARYELDDPEALDSPDAVKHFLSHNLPQRLKTRALRRLWRLNPVLANVDGLVDYGEDYTDAATVIEGLQTAYQVGKGMLAHLEAQTAQDTPDAEEDTAPRAEEEQDDTPLLAEASPAPAYEFQPLEDDAPVQSPARRRMTFQFESHT